MTPGRLTFNGLNQKNEINSRTNNFMQAPNLKQAPRLNQPQNAAYFEPIAHQADFRAHPASSSNFDWRCGSPIGSIAFDTANKRIFVAEPDEGKITTLDIQVSVDPEALRTPQTNGQKFYEGGSEEQAP